MRPETLADASRIVHVNMDAREPVNLVHYFTQRVRERAEAWESLGEDAGRNNRGPEIDRMLHISGVGRRDKNGHSKGGPWCAVGASTMLVEAAGGDARFAPFAPHRGAKKLTRNCGEAGSFIVKPQRWSIRRKTWKGALDPDRMAHAMFVAWHRGVTRETAWSGHIEIVDHYEPDTDTLHTWAPNVAPSVIKRMDLMHRYRPKKFGPKQAVWHLRTHGAGSWRRRLYAIATLEGFRG